MNAVNLIPRDGRARGDGRGVSPPTLALIGGLVIVLIAAVLYVTTANTVATRKSALAQVSAGVAGWTAAANSYSSFVTAAKRRTQELADVRQLANSRFPWSGLLGQIGGLMPRRAALSTLAASTASADGSSTATGATSVPGVQLTGCAASQSVVAQTMVQLRLVKGVSGVTLSSSTDSSTGSGGSSSSGQSSGGCPFPVQFQLSLTIPQSVAAGAASSGSASTTSAPASTTPTPAAAQ